MATKSIKDLVISTAANAAKNVADAAQAAQPASGTTTRNSAGEVVNTVNPKNASGASSSFASFQPSNAVLTLNPGETPSGPEKLPYILGQDNPSNKLYVDNAAGMGVGGVDYTPTNNDAETSDRPIGLPVVSSAVGYMPAKTTMPDFVFNNPYTDAANKMLEQISSGRTQYTDALNQAYQAYANRDKFSYDSSSDPLFQNYLSGMMASGKTAMQDTMGQASALTGGYGSTYATSAANQAYNGYVQQAYDNLADYYQMAMDAYNAEGERMMNTYGMLSQLDSNEYNRYLSSYNAYQQAGQQAYEQAAGAYQINQSNFWNQQDNEYKYYMAAQNQSQFDSDLTYKYDALGQNQSQFETEMDYKNAALAQDQSQFDAEMGYKNAALAQDQSQYEGDLGYKYDALSQSKKEHDAEMGYKYDALAQDKAQHESDLGYKYDALAQDNSQHESDLQYKYDALAQDNKQYYDGLSAKAAATATGSETEQLKTPTDTILQSARKVYETYGDEGTNGLYNFLEMYPAYDTEKIIEYAHGESVYSDDDGKVYSTGNSTAAYTDYDSRGYNKIVDKLFTSDNDVVSDAYGNSYTIKQWVELYSKALIDQGEIPSVAASKAKEFQKYLKGL